MTSLRVPVHTDDNSEVDDLPVWGVPRSCAGIQLDKVLQLRNGHGDRGLRRIVIRLTGHVFGLFPEVQDRGESPDSAEFVISPGDQAASWLAHAAFLNEDRRKLSGA